MEIENRIVLFDGLCNLCSGGARWLQDHQAPDAQGTLRYGLIAEEVAKVYPELVVLDRNGRIDGIRYDELAPMRLDEMKKEHATVADQAAEIRDLQRQLAKVNGPERELACLHWSLPS